MAIFPRSGVFALVLLAVVTVRGALPEGWTGTDIGGPAPAGNSTYTTSTTRFDVLGAGADIWGVSDQFHFANRAWTGDGEWTVRVDSVQNTNVWAKAGLMVRETLSPDSRHALLVLTPGNGVAFQRRKLLAGSSLNTQRTGLAAPGWLKLVRRGHQFDTYTSSDGLAWSWFTTDFIEMPPQVFVGLAMCSHRNGVLAAGAFTQFTATAPLPLSFPVGWTSQDIGGPLAYAGSADYRADNALLTVRAAGADIFGQADQFHFASRSWTGNAVLIARVDSLKNTNSWAKAGVMIRESAAPGARHAMVVVTPGSGVAFQRRTTTGGTSLNTARAGLASPLWVKLERWGDRFDGFYSTDGLSWIYLGTETIPMTASVQAGLALTSHNANALTEAVFSHLAVGPTGLPGGLWGEYFSDRNLSIPALQRLDSTVNFLWGPAAPAPQVPADNFSARWTGTLTPDVSQAYTFYTLGDDGVRLWIGDQLLVNDWTTHSTVENSGTLTLQAGQAYPVRMEYYDAGGSATVRLSWSAADRGKAVIATPFLRASQYPDSDGDGMADVIDAYPQDYYNNVAPLLTKLGGDQQTTAPGALNAAPFDIAVWRPDGSGPLVNAPVTFALETGGGGLVPASSPSATPAPSLGARTDSEGTAQSRFRQPATGGVTSKILVTAGTATTRFTTTSQVLDSDGDGLSDSEEATLGTDPTQADTDGDGLSDYIEARQNHTDPKDYFNGQHPIITQVSGGAQKGPVGSFLPEPWVVRVTDQSGQPQANAPVTFAVDQGGVATSDAADATTSTTLIVRTDANGNAWVYWKL